MIITHLAVEGVARFRTRHRVSGLGPGLNLLCAPNEAGKSTLFRALHAALFLRHGADTKDTRRLACLGAQLPAVVEVGFRRGSDDYLVRKAFLRGTSASVAKSGVPLAQGRAADEAIWSLLDLAPGGAGGEDSAFGLLWVRQGQSFEPPTPGDDTKAMLGRLIEAEVGQVLGGERGERVWKAVTDRLARDLTATGQPKAGGALKAAQDRVNEEQAKTEELAALLTTLEADRSALATKLRERDALCDPAAVAETQAALARAEHERNAAAAAARVAERAEMEQSRRELEAERAEKRRDEILELERRIAASRERIAALEHAHAEQAAAVVARAAELAAREAALARLADAARVAEHAMTQARRREAAARDIERVVDLTAKLARARALAGDLARVRHAAAAFAVSADAIRRIEDATRTLDRAQARRDAKATRVIVTPSAAGVGKISQDGEAISEEREIIVHAPLSLAIGDLATITVVPAAATDDAAQIDTARGALAKALRDANVLSLADARERRAKHDDLETEWRRLAAELSAIAPPHGREDGIAVLEQALAAAQVALEGIGDGASAATPEDRAGLAHAREIAEAAHDVARRDHVVAQSAIVTVRAELAATTNRRDTLREDLTIAERALAQDLAAAPDEGRTERVASLAAEAARALEAVRSAREAAATARAAVPDAHARDAIETRVTRLGRVRDERTTRIGDVEREIVRLQERIATRGGEGLGERAGEAAEALASARAELARIERGVAARRLLRDTLEASRRATQETFLGPVKAAIGPYLHTLFPGLRADAGLDTNFAVDALQRGGTESEPIALLSDGTREQIAVIVRLGLGRLLAERGRPVPIVLDDALVFSDDDRIERMFDVLTRAAEKQQVIVLTCRQRAFRDCGGRMLTIEPDA